MSFGGEFWPQGRLEGQWFMCRICKRRLNSRRSPDGEITEFLHTFKEDDDDHAPDVVPEQEMEHPSKIVCDFCGGEGVSFSYPCRTFSHRGHQSIGDWAACDFCSQDIERESLQPIAERQITRLIERGSFTADDPFVPLVKADIVAFQHKFIKNRRGKRETVAPR